MCMPCPQRPEESITSDSGYPALLEGHVLVRLPITLTKQHWCGTIVYNSVKYVLNKC